MPLYGSFVRWRSFFKREALADAEPTLASLSELLSAEDADVALEAALLRSLWGNQADLSLSAGELCKVSGGTLDQLLSDHRPLAVELLKEAQQVALVLDNHGLEVLCDLVLAESILRHTKATVTLHVKDAPVFVSDVTELDVPWVLDWLKEKLPALAKSLEEMQRRGS